MEQRAWICSRAVVLPHMNHKLMVTPAAIAIRGQTIDEVRQDVALAKADADAAHEPWRDLGDGLISPAFINAHTHLPMACFRGLGVEEATEHNVIEDLFFAVESRMTAADIRAFARMGAYESLLQGVGLVWEHYYGGLELAWALVDVGLAGVVAPTLQDCLGPGQHMCTAQYEATLQIASDTTRFASAGVFAALGPHATDTVSPELWSRIAKDAHTYNLPIHAHVAQSLEEFERCMERHQCTPVELLSKTGALDTQRVSSFLLVHAIFMTRQDLTLLDPAHHTLGFCPYSQLIFSFPAHVPSWDEAGIPWIVATDCAASNDSMNVQKEMRFASGVRHVESSYSHEYMEFLDSGSVKSAYAAQEKRTRLFHLRDHFVDETFLLDRVWRIPGAMHPSFKAGVIAPGYLANLTHWNPSHPSMWPGTQPLRSLAMADTSQAIEQMMVAGRWIGEAGDFHQSITRSDAYKDAVCEASMRFEQLKSRLGLA